MSSTPRKLKMYEKAYKKCLRSCKKSRCKTKCKSPFLDMDLKFKKKSLNPYQKFVKKEYPKYKNKNIHKNEIFKLIAEKWNKNK